ALLDQTILVGVGNIYASEALFDSSIHPLTPANKLSQAQVDSLLESVEKILQLAYQNCGTTFRSYVDGSGKAGNNIDYV
ncbi:formamidopyrimidine-DNA glycosylase, partial [bacterium LRH843]|nr:formamidopyrimidine-DNA glycosylase [bacterium LRH843]